MKPKLTARRVEAVFKDCLFRDGEDTSVAVMAEGVTTTAGFHPERLNAHRGEIEELLGELPDNFKKDTGGGWSFLKACVDKNGNQWTGFHSIMEHLFQLGIATGKVECQIPREYWEILPGGMPYYTIN